MNGVINSEYKNISFLLDLLNSNRDISISLIDYLINRFQVSDKNSEDTVKINQLLNEFKEILNSNSEAETILAKQKEALSELKKQDINSINELEKLMAEFSKTQDNVQSAYLNMNNFIPKLLDYMNSDLPVVKTPNIPVEDTVVKPTDILIISEKSGMVILPASKEEILLSYYKNPSISRFREAFKLMKNREKSSLVQAFDLSFELMFRYDIHPAVITACKNLDQLDVYISCIDNNVLDEFPFFEIKFEVAPLIVKEKKYKYEFSDEFSFKNLSSQSKEGKH